MTIYQVGTSTARATTDTLQYNGVFLDIPFLSCRVVSPTPIAWAIGDFITWNYDGVSYRLRDIPSASKQSTSGTYGEAFVYEDVKFYSDLSKTKSVDFLDYTPYDPTIHYSSLPKFSFYGKVSDLLARIGANMARYHADWVFTADDVESGDIYDALNEYKEISVENISCWDAIKLINSEWKIGFVYYYDTTTSKHTLVAGALGADTSSFSYGQGNGLYIIARAVSKEDSVVTRLRAYGSSENLPSRYYNNLLYADTPLIGESMYIPNLMIPYTEWGTTSSRPDVLKSYIDCNNPDVDATDTSFAKYGIRERSIFFDGNGLKEIKPTIENMTAGELRTAISAYTGTQTYFTPDVGYVNSDRMDLIKTGDDVTDDGYIEASTYYEETYAYTGDTGAEEITGREFYHTITSFAPATLMQEGEYTLLTDGLVVTLGNAEDRSYAFSSLEVFLMKNGSRSALVSTIEGVEVTLGDLQFTVPNIDFSVTDGGDIYSLELVISATISDKDYGDTTNFAWAISAADFIYRYKKLVPNDRFTIEVRDIGFDVYKFITAKLPAISMKTGACSGRQFRIRSSDKITGGWRFTCSRQIDDSLGSMYFPNNNTKIAALDQFVLVDLNMPDIYVEIASLRLYKEAIKWLRKNKETQYVYEPKIDEIYMALNPQVIKEGMSMPVTDTDLGIDNTVLINSVTINENGDGLRTYDVVLRDGTDETLLGYIDSKSKGVKTETVKFIVNAATPKTQSASETRIGLEAATLGYDDSLLWKAISAKEPLLPDTPTNPTEKFLNGNKEWAVLAMRHDNLMDKNGNPDYQHITQGNQTFLGIKTFSGAFTDMVENRNTRLRLPKVAPTSTTTDEYYLYATDSGFSGEVPSGGAITDLYSLTDVALTGITSSLPAGQMLLTSGTKWANVTASTTNISEGTNLYYTDARVKAYGDTLYTPIAHASATNNPHSVTAAQVGAAGLSGTPLTSGQDLNALTNVGTWYTTSTEIDASLLNRPTALTGECYILNRLADNLLEQTFLELNGYKRFVRAYRGGVWSDWRLEFNSGNSNLTSVDWTAAKLTSTTLLLPQSAPTLSSGEMAIYGLESGFSGELPSGAGSVDSVALVSNLTGISVTGSPITTSGTFTLNFVSGYSIPTNSKQSEWDNAYTLRHNAVTLGTANGLSLSTQVLSLGLASTSTNGALSSTDWNTFNGKQAKLIGTGAISLVRVNTSGVVTYDDSTYLTGNQTITLSGIITGSGTTTITTSIADNALSIAKTNGLQSALDGKLSTTGKAADSDKLDGNDSTYFATASQLNAANLSSGYLPYWNGSSLVDSPIYINGVITYINQSSGDNNYYFIHNKTSGYDGGTIWQISGANKWQEVVLDGGDLIFYTYAGSKVSLTLRATGDIEVTSTTQSTAYNNGGLIITGGLGIAKDLYSNGKAVFASSVQMSENINTNLRIPKVAPTSPTSGEYYFYIV